MWQTKYASAVTKNLEVGVDFRPYSEGEIPHWVSVVRAFHNFWPIRSIKMRGQITPTL